MVRDLPEINWFGEILLKGIRGDGADRRRTASMTDHNSSAELTNHTVSLGSTQTPIHYLFTTSRQVFTFSFNTDTLFCNTYTF